MLSPMTQDEFQFLQKLMRDRSANVLEAGKESTTVMRLSPVLKAEGLTTIGDLVKKLRATGVGRLHTQVVESLTVHESSFFRDPPVWSALREHVLPPLVRASAGRPFRAWCGATSLGQEPWSLAITLKRWFYTGTEQFHITATDISEKALAYAMAGRYTALEASRGLSPELSQRFLKPDAGGMSVSADIRPMVQFRRLNLCQDWPDLGQFDLILMRNVLYYFDPVDRRSVLDRAARLLYPGGVLLLGAGEIATHTPRDLTPHRFGTVPALRRGC